MPVTDSFLQLVIEQLEPLGPIVPKRMFGGVGLYAGDRFFGLVMEDVLYLKGDAATRAVRKAAGSRPFQPRNRPRGKGKNQYDSVPAAILEDADALIAWAKQAIAIAATASP
jgi:DNA transformation protein